MRALCSVIFAAFLLTTLGKPATALNPREADILGLRLGMPQSEVVARLQAQGITRISLQEDQAHCLGPAEDSCLDRITAPTRDGVLTIRFVARSGGAEPAAWSIAYTLAGRLPGEPEIIRKAVLDHFGQPTSASDPEVWCAEAAGSQCSPADQPQITFHQGPGTTSTISLIDPTAVIRAAP